jgi:CoA-transferase family III
VLGDVQRRPAITAMSVRQGGLLSECWRAVAGEQETLDCLEIIEQDAWLGGVLAVDELALGACSAALMAAAELAGARGAHRPTVEISGEHVALSFTSERHASSGGMPAGAGFAPLSRFVRCANGGWARTHGNYPHHAAALARALGIDITDDERAVARLRAAASKLDALELEEAVFAQGGCATALRSHESWAGDPAGRAVAATPLVEWLQTLRTQPRRAMAPLQNATRPADGLRVLDLTRVIAGPVAGRTLAALGAEVLRIDPPGLPELPHQHLDTGPGKRSAVLDLAEAERRETLLAGADVLLTGYRPGSLARFEMRPEELAERHPHLVQVSLSAWGTEGPWAQRRGFDSLVQVASGIAERCASEDGAPGVLAAQALDHSSGHLMAAAALCGLSRRAQGQEIAPARLSLARTAKTLLDAPPPAAPVTPATGAADPERHRAVFADTVLIAPPGALDGVPLSWRHGPRALGGDPAIW